MALSEIAELIRLARDGVSLLDGAQGTAQKVRDLFGQTPPPEAPAELAFAANDLLKQLVDARLSQAEILQRLHELEKEMKEMDRFEQEAARYALVTLPAGGQVFALKPDDDRGEPAHRVCPACFQTRKKSILQPKGRLLHCHACGADYENDPAADPPRQPPRGGMSI